MNYFKICLNVLLSFSTMVILTSIGCNETSYAHIYIADNKTSDTLGFRDVEWITFMAEDSIFYDSTVVYMNHIVPNESKEINRSDQTKISIPDSPLPCNRICCDTLFKIVNNQPVPVLLFDEITSELSTFDEMYGQECMGIISDSIISNSELNN